MIIDVEWDSSNLLWLERESYLDLLLPQVELVHVDAQPTHYDKEISFFFNLLLKIYIIWRVAIHTLGQMNGQSVYGTRN